MSLLHRRRFDRTSILCCVLFSCSMWKFVDISLYSNALLNLNWCAVAWLPTEITSPFSNCRCHNGVSIAYNSKSRCATAIDYCQALVYLDQNHFCILIHQSYWKLYRFFMNKTWKIPIMKWFVFLKYYEIAIWFDFYRKE